VSGVARQGMFGFVGAVVTGAGGLVLTVVVGRTLDGEGTGVFFTAVALFTIATSVLLLGADTGLVRALSAARATGRGADLVPTFRAAARPVLLAAALAALVWWLVAAPLAERAFDPDGDLPVALRLLAPFLVFSVLSVLLLNGASRGLGGIRTYTTLQQVFLPVARPVLVVVAVLVVGGSSGSAVVWALLAWVVPLVVTVLLGGLDVRRRMQAKAAEARATGADPARPGIGREFWRVTAPRGVAATFEVLNVWADVVLVTVLLGPVQAGIYAAASRFVTSGTLAMQAIRLAIAPALASAFSTGDRAAVERLHRAASVGAILSTWPIYLTLAIFAPTILSILGPDFEAAAPALTILSLAMLAVAAAGNANTVLNMAGRTGWAAVNTGIATAVMLGLDLLLVPRFGIVGAAIGWGAAMITDATLGTLRVRSGLAIRSFDGTVVLAALVALVGIGVPALLVRLAVGPGFLGLLAGLVVAGAAYLGLLAVQRRRLGLDAVLTSLRR